MPFQSFRKTSLTQLPSGRLTLRSLQSCTARRPGHSGVAARARHAQQGIDRVGAPAVDHAAAGAQEAAIDALARSPRTW
jgi:hypothetical protein